MVFEYRSDSALDTLVTYAEFTRLPDRLQRFNIEDSEHFVFGLTFSDLCSIYQAFRQIIKI